MERNETDATAIAPSRFFELSFVAGIAFGVLALAGLLGAGLVFRSVTTTLLALVAIGLSYLAQTIYTMTAGESRLGYFCHVAAALFWLLGFLAFLGAR